MRHLHFVPLAWKTAVEKQLSTDIAGINILRAG